MRSLSNNDELFYVEIANEEVSDIRYLKFINSKKCITAKFIDYSPFKYFFSVEKDKLVDIEYMSRKDFNDKFKNYDIEIIKYKKEENSYWQDYERPKRDYNWKYEIAIGINKNWVMMKKELLDNFLKEIKELQEGQKDNLNKSETLKILNKNCDDMLEGLSSPMACHNTFIKPGASGFLNIEMTRSTAFFDTMLKEYNKLLTKYEKRPEHAVYAVLIDFQNLIKDNKNLSYMEKQVVNLIMQKGFNYDTIIEMLNSNFIRKNKPFDKTYVKQMVDYAIPNKLFKQYDLLCKRNSI